MKSVILGSPVLLILYGLALLLCIFDLIRRASGYLFPILSALIFVGATVYAFLLGAGYEELGLVTLIFLALNIGDFVRTGGKK